MKLPVAFEERMKGMLGSEYEAFAASYGKERSQGLRLNLLKTDRAVFLQQTPFSLRQISWAEEGFYYGAGERPGRHPYHEAGVYYIQEPSAMAVVTLLDPQPGEKILDLCAAPGGKTTQIASRLQGRGLLVTNEIHPARARILSQNVERMGVRNAVVTNEDSGRLAGVFCQYFDRIVVDAPCSGEGMFRKDEEAVSQWSPENVERCAVRQQEILDHAAFMLKPGGRMVYSTCTFAPEENEKTVSRFLQKHPDFFLEAAPDFPGLSKGVPQWGEEGDWHLGRTVRIWPHRAEGEGHYMAVLGKNGEEAESRRDGKRKAVSRIKDKNLLAAYENFCRETLREPESWITGKEFVLFGDQLYAMPPEMIPCDGLRVLRPGLHLGSFKKNRFEPSHGLAMALKEEEVQQSRRMDGSGREIASYLRGEALTDFSETAPGPVRKTGEESRPVRKEQKGWILMTVDGYSVGWAKLSGGVLKNHYPKGLRQS